MHYNHSTGMHPSHLAYPASNSSYYSNNQSEDTQSTCSSNSSHHAKGNCISDLVTSHMESLSPLVIFECKSRSDKRSLQKGMAQLISFGLSLRYNQQLSCKLKLVLITPISWCSASLPPYEEKLSVILFSEYQVFKIFNLKDDKIICLDRTAYTNFMTDLRHHFQSVKQSDW